MTGTVTVAVLGATGSIGTQTLDVVRADPDRYRVTAIGASTSVEQLAAQAREFRPETVALADPTCGRLRDAINCEIYKAFAEHGVQIPFPQRDVHIREMPRPG